LYLINYYGSITVLGKPLNDSLFSLFLQQVFLAAYLLLNTELYAGFFPFVIIYFFLVFV